MNREALEEVCKHMREKMLSLTYESGLRVHIASSLSLTEILAVLFKEVMNLPDDTFVLSKGHAGLAYYVALAEAGLITAEELNSFGVDGGDFPSHPTRNLCYGIECSTGSLGMGLSYCVGRAIGLKKRGQDSNIYCVLGDGECNEGSVWEGAMLAGQIKLDNLIVVVDLNRMQSDGNSAEILDLNMDEIWRAYGWEVITASGHDVCALKEALRYDHVGKPLAVLAETVKGKGVSFMENQSAWHHKNLTKEQYEQAVLEVQNGV